MTETNPHLDFDPAQQQRISNLVASIMPGLESHDRKKIFARAALIFTFLILFLQAAMRLARKFAR